jgi:hypothetical protein
MKDVNSALLQSYYEVINGLSLPVYEGEEPDNMTDKIYVVISDVFTNETSTDNSSDVQATVQVSVHSWENKYNNTKSLNTTVGQILEAIKSDSKSVLDLSLYGLQMLNLSVQSDRTERYGELGGRVYISRILVFKQDIFII